MRDYQTLIDRAQASKRHYSEILKEATTQSEKWTARHVALEEAQVFLQMVAKNTQEKIRFKLEDIVNLALTAVFGTRYRFEIKFELKRGQTEAALVLYDGDGNELDPLETNGGGLADILSFSLRIALLIISKNRRVLILDEPMKFVSADLRQTCYALMKKLSHDLGIQIIAVTHEEEFVDKADTVYRIRQKEGVSWAQNLSSSTHAPAAEPIET